MQRQRGRVGAGIAEELTVLEQMAPTADTRPFSERLAEAEAEAAAVKARIREDAKKALEQKARENARPFSERLAEAKAKAAAAKERVRLDAKKALEEKARARENARPFTERLAEAVARSAAEKERIRQDVSRISQMPRYVLAPVSARDAVVVVAVSANNKKDFDAIDDADVPDLDLDLGVEYLSLDDSADYLSAKEEEEAFGEAEEQAEPEGTLVKEAADIYVETVVARAGMMTRAKASAASFASAAASKSASISKAASTFALGATKLLTKAAVNKALQELVYKQVEAALPGMTGKAAALGLRIVVDAVTEKLTLHGATLLMPEPLYQYYAEQARLQVEAQQQQQQATRRQTSSVASGAPPPAPEAASKLSKILKNGQAAFVKQFGVSPQEMLVQWLGSELVLAVTQTAFSLLSGEVTPEQAFAKLLDSDHMKNLIVGGVSRNYAKVWEGVSGLGVAASKVAVEKAARNLVFYALSQMSDGGLVAAVGRKMAARLRQSFLGEIKLSDADYFGVIDKFRARMLRRGTPAEQLEFLDASVADLAVGMSARVNQAVMRLVVDKMTDNVWDTVAKEVKQQRDAGAQFDTVAGSLNAARTVTLNSFVSLLKDGVSTAQALKAGAEQGVSAFAGWYGSRVSERALEQRRQERRARAEARRLGHEAEDRARAEEANLANYEAANRQMAEEQAEARRLVETGQDPAALRRLNDEMLRNLDASRYADWLQSKDAPPKREPIDAETRRKLEAAQTLGEGVTFTAPARAAAQAAAGGLVSKAFGALDMAGAKYDYIVGGVKVANNLGRVGASVAAETLAEDGSFMQSYLRDLRKAGDATAGVLSYLPSYGKSRQWLASMMLGEDASQDLVDAGAVGQKLASNVLLSLSTRGAAGMGWRDAALEAGGDLAWGLSASSTAAAPDRAWQAARGATSQAAATVGQAASRLGQFLAQEQDRDAVFQRRQAAEEALYEQGRRAAAAAKPESREKLVHMRVKPQQQQSQTASRA